MYTFRKHALTFFKSVVCVLVKNDKYSIFRHILAILHFNENLQRTRKLDKNGSVVINVSYPKYKLGEEVVREIAIPPTYGKDLVKSTWVKFYSENSHRIWNSDVSLLTSVKHLKHQSHLKLLLI